MPSSSSQTGLPKRSILLVDDDRLIIANMTDELVMAGYLVSSASSVDKAEVWLKTNKKPDLVVLDVHMPVRSGLELAKCLKEEYKIPFILLTAYSEEAIVTQANEFGAMGYLVKPADSNRLIPAIETALSRVDYIQKMADTNLQLQSVLDINREINIAIGITMNQFGRNRNDAFELLRSAARNQNRKLSSVVNEVIDLCESAVNKVDKK